MRIKVTCFALLSSLILSNSYGQSFPDEIYLDANQHMMLTGNKVETGFYDESRIDTIHLLFSQANYWTTLTNNYATKTNLAATLIYNGDTLPAQVGVRFKGNTSYQMVTNSQKKSFNISVDWIDSTQDLEGVETINLNNAFEDASFMREVSYCRQIRKHIPAARANFIRLYINGQSWGVYPNVEQINRDMMEAWYYKKTGSLWRADRSTGGGGGGPQWGDGTAGLNYLGASATPYQTYYTLKGTDDPTPWDELITVCDKLNNLSLTALDSTLATYLDIDRTLWFLASEIAFSDDDSYVYKGKMDYYLYLDPTTGRMELQEFDGNTVMKTNNATWSPFYNETKVNYPLLNRLLQVPALRQRYLAHMRTLISEEMDTTQFNNLISTYDALISAEVNADTKKLYSFTQFTSEKTVIKNFVRNHRNTMLANSEVNQPSPIISQVTMQSQAGVWASPLEGEVANVTATATHVGGIAQVYLYYSDELSGIFKKVLMYDDGSHNDGSAGDNVFGGSIPGFPAGSPVRFYIEAKASNPAGTLAYSPPGAEHNVYFYSVDAAWASEQTVVINEVMASNQLTAIDENGDDDDWIELYNKGSQPVDISGWFLTDNVLNVDKWSFPAGTVLQPDSYLIVWADEDSSDGPNHANFKLDKEGEFLILLNSQRKKVDTVNFGLQTTDVGYARVPNGTGPFVFQAPTFNANNSPDTTTSLNDEPTVTKEMHVFPNPTQSRLIISLKGFEEGETVTLLNVLGEVMYQAPAESYMRLDISGFSSGVYFVQSGQQTKRLVVNR